jgi:hypothetical protein
MSIQYDSTELLNTTYRPQYSKHESAPERFLNSLPLARSDGEALISERYGTKTIYLKGVLTGSSQDDLESKIDAFKELFSRTEKNLDISWNGGTRRYVASCKSHAFDRDFYHISIVPWTAEFTVLSGEGKATSTTTALNEHAVTVTTPGSDSFTLTGTKPARPVITIKGNNFSGQSGVEYKNTDTGEKLVFCLPTGQFGNTDIVVIDCDARTVKYSNDGGSTYITENFYGVFPAFKVGTNNVQITVGDIVNQTSLEASVSDLGSFPLLTATTHRLAQSFSVPYTDATFRRAKLALVKSGTPSGNITVEIQADNGGKPSGSAVTNGSATITPASVSTSAAYVTATFSDRVTLSANTKYWLVISAASTVDGSNSYGWGGTSGNYPGGKYKKSTDSGASYSEPTAGFGLAFKILYGNAADTSSVKHSVVYTPLYL